MITQDALKHRVNYDPATGDFTWNNPVRHKSLAGKEIGSINKNGYLRITVNGKRSLSHRMAWLYVYGDAPDGFIDHINGVKTDNRISNLRICNKSENGQNQRRPRSDNKSGFLGVFKGTGSKKNPWCAQIQFNGKSNHIGNYPTPEDAHHAYVMKKREVHPFGEL